MMIPGPALTHTPCRGCGVVLKRGRWFHCDECHASFAGKSQSDAHTDFHYLILGDRCPDVDEMLRAGLVSKTEFDVEVWHGRISRIDMQLATADLSAFDDVPKQKPARPQPVITTPTVPDDLVVEVIGGEEFVEVGPPTPATIKKIVEKRFKEREHGVPSVIFEGAFDFGKHGFHRYADGRCHIVRATDLKIKPSSWVTSAREYGDRYNFRTEARVFRDDDDGNVEKIALRYVDLEDKDFKR